MENIRVIFLGTGDAFFAGGRCQSAYLVQSPEGSLLVDCGSTALASLQLCGLAAEPIDTIFLSHLHGDHFAGLPFLFLHYTYIEPRSRTLRIIGPPEVESRVMMLYRAMYADAAAEPLPFPIEFIEAQPGKQDSFNGISVRPFIVPHLQSPPSFGCEIEVGGRRIVYSGDAGWMEDLVALSQNADLFICECNYFESRSAIHMDYPRIMENFSRFGARRMVLTHLGGEVLQHRHEIGLEMAYDGLVIEL